MEAEITQKLLALVEMMRPRQWTKNLLIFAALIFTGSVLDIGLLSKTCLAFLFFCLASSSVYLFNDIVDLQSDRQHPLKSKRPLVRGAISKNTAGVTAALLSASAIIGAFFLSSLFGFIVAIYLALFTLYGFFLKHIVIIDVFTIAAGFVLRAVAGAVVLNLSISPWLLICTVLLALFLSFGKRRHELLLLEGRAFRHRKILNEYSEALLDQMISVVASATVAAYGLYTFNSPTAGKSHLLMMTIPFVLYGIFRYLYLMHKKNLGGSPEGVLLSDKALALDIILWAAACTIIVYFAK